MKIDWDIYDEVKALPSTNHGMFGPRDTDWVRWRDIPATSEDGRPVTLWAMRMPAQFYRLTTGDIEITTGSGPEMGCLMLQLGQAIADGMIGFRWSQQP